MILLKTGLIAWEKLSSDASQMLHQSYQKFKYKISDVSLYVINLASLELDLRLSPFFPFFDCYFLKKMVHLKHIIHSDRMQ